MKRIKFFASILLMLCLSVVCCAQTKIDWKQIKNIPDTLEFKNVLLEHLLFKSAYQPVMESIHQGAIYYDNMTERMRIYENGQWRDLSVTIASDSIGAPLTILGYLQANDIYATQSAYIGKDVNVKGNVNASQSAYIGKDVNVKGNVNASGTSTFNYLKVNNALKVPTVASAALGVGSIYYNPTTKKLNILNSSNQWEPISIEVDSALSTTSTNPVQNKVITAKINQTDANLINGMATTLQQSYNYANGIAAQAYNYADSAATDAETASKNYADLQIRLLNSTISEKLASGTSDLYVRSIRTTNASVTNLLHARSINTDYALTVPSAYDSSLLPTGSTNRKANIFFDSTDQALNYAYRNSSNLIVTKKLATVDGTVSDVATGSNNTIAVTKNGVTTNIAVGGEGKNPSSSTPPSNPTVGQMYFDTGDQMLKYWNGTSWKTIGDVYQPISSTITEYNSTNGIINDYCSLLQVTAITTSSFNVSIYYNNTPLLSDFPANLPGTGGSAVTFFLFRGETITFSTNVRAIKRVILH